jgi:hypothetical protein
MSQKVTLVLSEAAQRIIRENATDRARGEWVSGVLTEWEQVRAVDGVGAIERLEAQIVRLSDQIRVLAGVRQ